MSRYFLLGGFAGFAMIFFLTLSTGSNIHLALRNGMIACLVMALLIRYFFYCVSVACLRNRLRELERMERMERVECEAGEASEGGGR